MKRKWIAIVAESEERKTPSLSLIFKKKVQIFQTLHSAWAGIGTHLWCFLFVWDRCSLSWAVFAAGFQMEYLSWRCLWYCLEISLSEHFFFLPKMGSEWFIWKACLLGGSLFGNYLCSACYCNTAVGWGSLCAVGLVRGSSATGFLPEQYLFTCSSEVKLCL